MADAAGNYSGGDGGGVNDWELVSLTASTYAAAPGSVLPLSDAHNTTESHSAASAAIFMSQHFNLPAAEALISADPNSGRAEEEEESNPAAMVVDDEACDADDLGIPCPEHGRETEMEGDNSLKRSSDSRKNLSTTLDLYDGNALLLQGGAISACLPVVVEEERQATIIAFRTARTDAAASDTTTSVHRLVFAGSDSVINVVDSASLAANHVAPVAGGAALLAPNKKAPLPSGEIPCEAQAWWNRTFRFLRSNSKESLTFRFIFVIAGLAVLGQRDKLRLRLEFNVDTEKISCTVRKPLGQAKLNMLVGGRPIAQGLLS